MRNTLRQFVEYYDPEKITIIVAENTISIDMNKQGSWFVYRHFWKDKLYFKSFENEVLTVTASEGE